MHIESMNRPVLALDDVHPAKRFLSAFIDCRVNCVGRHHGLGGQVPIDQAWISASDGKVWKFSEFAYKALSFDIELDGFLTKACYLTESETFAAQQMPLLRSMMNECGEAARHSGNKEIVELTDQVLEMLGLWEQYLNFRKDMISHTHD